MKYNLYPVKLTFSIQLSPSFLKGIFAGYRILGWLLLSAFSRHSLASEMHFSPSGNQSHFSLCISLQVVSFLFRLLLSLLTVCWAFWTRAFIPLFLQLSCAPPGMTPIKHTFVPEIPRLCLFISVEPFFSLGFGWRSFHCYFFMVTDLFCGSILFLFVCYISPLMSSGFDILKIFSDCVSSWYKVFAC